MEGEAHAGDASPEAAPVKRKRGRPKGPVVEGAPTREVRNRQSAERSRQRRVAYVTELEEEVVRLRKENEELSTKLGALQAAAAQR